MNISKVRFINDLISNDYEILDVKFKEEVNKAIIGARDTYAYHVLLKLLKHARWIWHVTLN